MANSVTMQTLQARRHRLENVFESLLTSPIPSQSRPEIPCPDQFARGKPAAIKRPRQSLNAGCASVDSRNTPAPQLHGDGQLAKGPRRPAKENSPRNKTQQAAMQIAAHQTVAA